MSVDGLRSSLIAASVEAFGTRTFPDDAVKTIGGRCDTSGRGRSTSGPPGSGDERIGFPNREAPCGHEVPETENRTDVALCPRVVGRRPLRLPLTGPRARLGWLVGCAAEQSLEGGPRDGAEL